MQVLIFLLFFSVSKCDVEEAREFYNVSRFSYPIYLDIDGAFEKKIKYFVILYIPYFRNTII